MAWYPVLGYGVFWIGLVVAIIMFATLRKFYPIMYLASVSLYIFTIGYIIDVFDVKKNGILAILAFSAVLMLGVGSYLSKKLRHTPKKTKRRK